MRMATALANSFLEVQGLVGNPVHLLVAGISSNDDTLRILLDFRFASVSIAWIPQHVLGLA